MLEMTALTAARQRGCAERRGTVPVHLADMLTHTPNVFTTTVIIRIFFNRVWLFWGRQQPPSSL